MKKELKIRLVGNNIKPEKIRAKHFSQLVLAYEQALIGLLEKHAPDKKNDAYLSVVGVTNESSGIVTQPSIDFMLPMANMMHEAINNNTADKLPPKTVENLMEMQKITKRAQCIAELTGQEGVASTKITPKTELYAKKRSLLKGENTIYGKIIKIGGVNPRITLKLLHGSDLSFKIKESDAKKLAPHLYGDIGVNGISVWNETNDVVDMIPTNFIIMSKEPMETRFKKLAGHLGEYWKDRNPDEYVRALRG